MPASLHYLKARRRAEERAPTARRWSRKMKEMPTDDPLFGKGTIRADGRKIHDAYLFEVKKPAESKYPGDFYKVKRHDPGGGGVPSAQGGGCPLVSG